MWSWNKGGQVYLHRLHYPVKVLGEGNRLGIWLQGCSIRCPGCVNQELQERHPENALDVGRLFAMLSGYEHESISGITVTGGEPFDQPEGLLHIACMARKLNLGEILVYSGYDFSFLVERYKQILDQLDVVISGPFVESMPTNKIWRGSDNQEIHLLSPSAKKRYPVGINQQEYSETHRPIQFSLVNESLYLIGIPRRGDIHQLKNSCEKFGVLLS